MLVYKIVVPLIVVILAVPLAAEASVATLTKRQAKKAVKREARAEYDLPYAEVRCQRLTRLRFKCRFQGLTDRDVVEGNVDGHRGRARVRRYARGVDVRFSGFRRGSYW